VVCGANIFEYWCNVGADTIYGGAVVVYLLWWVGFGGGICGDWDFVQYCGAD
jgi:hypothetical protein